MALQATLWCWWFLWPNCEGFSDFGGFSVLVLAWIAQRPKSFQE